MRPITNEYLDLVAEFQVFLFQDYSRQSWLEVSRESYLHYRNYAMSRSQGAVDRSPGPEAKSQEQIVRQEPVARRHEPEKRSQEPEAKSTPQPEDKSHKSEVREQTPSVKSNEQLSPIEKQDFSDIRKILAEHFPEQIILSQPPDDTSAKKIKNGWNHSPQLPKIFLVVTNPLPRHSSLLANLCHALKIVHGVKADIIEKSQLGAVKEPLIELEDLDVYLREPKRKAHLWNTISKRVKGEGKV